jgi:phosphate transport system substrate-binding protein
MRSNVKRVLLLIAVTITVVFLAATVFSGCKTDTAAETTAAETNATETAAAETTAGETSADQGGTNFDGKTLVISGSTTLLEVSNAWAEAFMAKFGGEITVNGGGSGVGIADAINGANDLGNASRQIKDKEIDEAKAAGVDIEEHEVLFDGISVIVSKNIDVKELTIAQLSDIYVGNIKNWKDVGGPDAEIITVARDSSSGTGEYFLERVVTLDGEAEDNDYGDHCLRLQSNADIANQVSDNENAIGYIGLGYLASVEGKANVIAVIAEDASAGVLPSVATVKDGSYPISRGLYVYSNKNNYSDFAKAFVDFMFSDEGQTIGAEAGFVPLS